MARDEQTRAQRDLLVTPIYEADSWVTLDLIARSREAAALDGPRDLAVAVDGDCLRQAMLLRLLTPQGSLADLGHPDYGSRMHELIGRPNDDATRRLAKSFVLQALAQERRVAEVLEVVVDAPEQLARDQLRIHIRVLRAENREPVALGIEVAL